MLHYYGKAHQLATTVGSVQQRGQTSYLYSYYLIASNDFDKALEILDFNLTHKDQISYEMLGNTYYNLGSLFYLKEEYDTAIPYFMEAEHLFELAKNNTWLARTQVQLSTMYAQQGNSKMERYFADASLTTLNQGKKGSLDKTPKTISEKITFLTEQLNKEKESQNAVVKSHLHYSLGHAYFSDKNYSEAIKWFEASIAAKQRLGYSNLIPATKTYIAEGYIEMGQFKNAISILNTLQISEKRKRPLVVENLLTEAYKGIGDYKKALYHNERLSNLQDSLTALDENERIAEITVKYDTNGKEEQILALQKENQAAKAQLHKERNRWVLWVILATLLLLSTIWMARRWKRSQRTVVKVQHEKDVIQKKVEAEHLLLKNKKKVYLEELQFIKSDGNYVEFHLIERKTLDRNKLKTILSQLPPNFVRVHRSYIVNKNEIESFSSSTVFLRSGKEIPLSRTFKSNLE